MNWWQAVLSYLGIIAFWFVACFGGAWAETKIQTRIARRLFGPSEGRNS